MFPRWAIDQDGQLLQPNKRDQFRFGHNRFFRPPAHGEAKAITPESITQKQVQDIFRAVLRELSVANEVLLNPEEVYGFFLAVEDAVVDLDAIFNQGSEEAEHEKEHQRIA